MQSDAFAQSLLRVIDRNDRYLLVHKPAGVPIVSPVSGRDWALADMLERLGMIDSAAEWICCHDADAEYSGPVTLARGSDAAAVLLTENCDDDAVVRFNSGVGKRKTATINLSPDAPQSGSPTETELRRRADRALAQRLPLLVDDRTNAYRLIDGELDGLPGVVVDRFADCLVVRVLEGKKGGDREAARRLATHLMDRLAIASAVVKYIPKDRSCAKPGAATVLSERLGQAFTDEPTEIIEDQIRYRVRLTDGWTEGFFVEHRENRRWIAEQADGRRFLNLFSYTCAFSVAAAVAGATSTANVDLSKRSLEWGKENLRANGMDETAHRFYRSDVREFLKRARRQGLLFDLIVLDAPTFSRTKKPRRTFQVERDLCDLLGDVTEAAARSARLLVTINHHGLSADWLRQVVRRATGHRRAGLLNGPAVPLGLAGAGGKAQAVAVELDQR